MKYFQVCVQATPSEVNLKSLVMLAYWQSLRMYLLLNLLFAARGWLGEVWSGHTPSEPSQEAAPLLLAGHKPADYIYTALVTLKSHTAGVSC